VKDQSAEISKGKRREKLFDVLQGKKIDGGGGPSRAKLPEDPHAKIDLAGIIKARNPRSSPKKKLGHDFLQLRRLEDHTGTRHKK